MLAHPDLPSLVTGDFPVFNMHPFVQLFREFSFLNIEKGPWIVGGAVRRALCGLPMENGDIDIFCRSQEDVRKAIEFLFQECKATGSRSTANATNVDVRGTPVQIITKPFATLEECLASVDFNICVAATDGWRWVADMRFFEDITTKRLTMNSSAWRAQQPMRLVKYAEMGFVPEPGLLTRALRLDDEEWLKHRSRHGGKLEVDTKDYEL